MVVTAVLVVIENAVADWSSAALVAVVGMVGVVDCRFLTRCLASLPERGELGGILVGSAGLRDLKGMAQR